jgi:hypothetical protein
MPLRQVVAAASRSKPPRRVLHRLRLTWYAGASAIPSTGHAYVSQSRRPRAATPAPACERRYPLAAGCIAEPIHQRSSQPPRVSTAALSIVHEPFAGTLSRIHAEPMMRRRWGTGLGDRLAQGAVREQLLLDASLDNIAVRSRIAYTRAAPCALRPGRRGASPVHEAASAHDRVSSERHANSPSNLGVS